MITYSRPFIHHFNVIESLIYQILFWIQNYKKTFEAYDLTEFRKQIAKKGKNCPERQIVKRAIQKTG